MDRSKIKSLSDAIEAGLEIKISITKTGNLIVRYALDGEECLERVRIRHKYNME